MVLDFLYLSPSTAPFRWQRLVHPTIREFQELHVAPDIPHDTVHAAVPDLTVHPLFGLVHCFIHFGILEYQ